MIPKVADATTPSVPTPESSKRIVEAYLADYFKDRSQQALTMDKSYGNIWQAVDRLFVAGGKRIRPHTTLLAYSAYASDNTTSAIVPAAAAQELLHLAMLIHDDIIDRDHIRYGIPNVAGQYMNTYGKSDDATHFASSAALLAGDLLLSDAYSLLSNCDIPPERALSALRTLNDAVFTVIGGELLDTETAMMQHGEVKPLDIALYKTASYSFVGPLLMGANLAHDTPEHEQLLLRTLGETIGVAFQLQDDLLGMFGDSAITGKSTTSDLSEGKYTYLTQLFYEQATAEQIREYETCSGTANLTTEMIENAQELLISTGTKQSLENVIQAMTVTAKELIEKLSINDDHKQAFHALLESSVARVK